MRDNAFNSNHKPMSNFKFKTTNIKGKEYVEVNQRVLFFRNEEQYSGWSMTSEILHLTDESCVIKATIRNAEGAEIASGIAQEDKSSSYINKTSFVENCETSAWGRALGNLGIGIETSIASSNEVSMAIAKQSIPDERKPLTEALIASMKKAVKDGKGDQVRQALKDKYVADEKTVKAILG